MSRLTKEKIGFIADQLSNNDSSSDAEMILDLAQKIGKPVCKVSKLVKENRDRFLNGIVVYPEKIIRKYLK